MTLARFMGILYERGTDFLLRLLFRAEALLEAAVKMAKANKSWLRSQVYTEAY